MTMSKLANLVGTFFKMSWALPHHVLLKMVAPAVEQHGTFILMVQKEKGNDLAEHGGLTSDEETSLRSLFDKLKWEDETSIQEYAILRRPDDKALEVSFTLTYECKEFDVPPVHKLTFRYDVERAEMAALQTAFNKHMRTVEAVQAYPLKQEG